MRRQEHLNKIVDGTRLTQDREHLSFVTSDAMKAAARELVEKYIAKTKAEQSGDEQAKISAEREYQKSIKELKRVTIEDNETLKPSIFKRYKLPVQMQITKRIDGSLNQLVAMAAKGTECENSPPQPFGNGQKLGG